MRVSASPPAPRLRKMTLNEASHVANGYCALGSDMTRALRFLPRGQRWSGSGRV